MFRLLGFILISTSIFACDVCNLSTGLLTTDPVNWVSFEQRQVIGSGDFSNVLKHTGLEGGSSTEFFNSSDITLRYFVYKNWYLRSTFGWGYNFVKTDVSEDWVSGLADPQVLLGYQYLYIGEKDFVLSSELMTGFGLPLGAYKDGVSAEYSPGSRAWSFLIGAQNIMKKGSFGFVLNASYLHNRPNPWGYWYGDALNMDAGILLDLVEREDFEVSLILGAHWEKDFADGKEGIYLFNSYSEYVGWQPQLVFNYKQKLQVQANYSGQLFADFPGWENTSIQGWSLSAMYSF